MKVRTRFAPSPTGPLHMGGARTALFNYIFAKKEGGDFVLRIEDTDKERSEQKWEQDLLENLQWLGLEWDEEIIRQSERTQIYKEYLEKLLKEEKAYWCFCLTEELEAQRQDQSSRGEAPRYTGTCKQLSSKEQEEALEAGKKGVIRFVVEPKKVSFKDIIRGEIIFDAALLGDIVIAKDLETPLYNFTVVIDDALMNITHVIRGEDHIPNTPKQILLYEALGLKKTVQYAHLPLILGEDRTKLSKRHGDNSVTRFRKEGYLPEAIINFLALLGWNPGDEREIFSLQSLAKEFSLEKTQKSGAIFNIKRLDWINSFYIKQKKPAELAELCQPYIEKAGFTALPKTLALEEVVVLFQERMKKLSDIVELADFFFNGELDYSKELLCWKNATKETTIDALKKAEEIISSINENDWSKETLETLLMAEAEKTGDRGQFLWPLRVALTGKKASPGPFEVAEILGKEKSLERIERAKEKI